MGQIFLPWPWFAGKKEDGKDQGGAGSVGCVGAVGFWGECLAPLVPPHRIHPGLPSGRGQHLETGKDREMESSCLSV